MTARRARAESFMVAIPVTGNKGKEWIARRPVGLHVKVPCFFATHARFHRVPRTSLATVGLNRSTRANVPECGWGRPAR